jgi:hypothetical protein
MKEEKQTELKPSNMKEEIKKKIEEEAVQFSKSNYADSLPDELIDKLSFIKGAEYGYSLAQQSVNSELANEVLKVWNEDGDNGEIQMKTPIAWYRVIRKAEDLLSASQNQQNEKPINWNQLREEFFDECTDNIYCNDGNNKLVVNIAPHDLFMWWKNKIENNDK